MSLIVALLVLSFLIFFHELGHFLAARYFGVHVEVFSIGFGKRFYTRKIGDTEFSLSVIPLGGYVRMKGQDDLDPAKKNYDSDSYNALRPLQRIAILFAGPLANFVLAFALFYTIALAGMPTLGTKVAKPMENTPAFTAGILKGDIIRQVNGVDVQTNRTLSEIIAQSENGLELIIERDSKLIRITLMPQMIESQNFFGETIQRKMIGIILDGSYRVTVDYSLFSAIGEAWYLTLDASQKIAQGVQKLIEGVVPMKELGGVISIVDVTSKASNESFVLLLFITALISVNLGILNLLPIPALDGGHIMFNLYEMLTRRVPSEKIMINITIAGWALLLGLMSIGIYNDINRLMAP